MENKFKKALLEDKVSEFILGEDEFFVLDREIGIHWPLGSYKKYIETYLFDKNENYMEENIWNIIIQSFNKSKDQNAFMDNLIAYLIPYYSNNEFVRIRKKHTPMNFIDSINKFIIKNKNSLEIDKRGSGVEWNSEKGMLGGILSNLKVIKERGGPNFIPEKLDKID